MKEENQIQEKKFTASYLFDDGDGSVEWCLNFYAKDWEEAKLKIKAIKETLKLDGQVDSEISFEG